MVKRAARTPVPRLHVTRRAAASLPDQIAERLRAAIRCGGLPVGTRLPATRPFADALGVSRNTILTAYAELFADGLVVGRVGDGSYVARTIRRVEFADPDGNTLFVMAMI